MYCFKNLVIMQYTCFRINRYPSGAIYQGLWAYGKKHGKGVYFFPNGDTVEGNWVEDRIEGQSKSFKTSLIISLMWITHQICKFYSYHRKIYLCVAYHFSDLIDWSQIICSKGNVVYFFGDGDTYEGGFANEKMHGKGALSSTCIPMMFNDPQFLPKSSPCTSLQ